MNQTVLGHGTSSRERMIAGTMAFAAFDNTMTFRSYGRRRELYLSKPVSEDVPRGRKADHPPAARLAHL